MAILPPGNQSIIYERLRVVIPVIPPSLGHLLDFDIEASNLEPARIVTMER